MALTGFSTSNYLSLGSAPVSAAPLTIACWVYSPVNNAFQNVLGVYHSGSVENRNCFKMNLDNFGKIRATVANASAEANATSTTSISTNTWLHGAAVFASASSRTIFLNGVNEGSETTNRSPASTPNRIFVGVGGGTLSTPLNAGTRVAEAAIWNVALTSDEVAVLAKGFSPLHVRPQNIVSYIPLIRNPVDYKDGGLSLTGSVSAADHCRVLAAA